MREDDGNNQRENAIYKPRNVRGHQKLGERAKIHSLSQPLEGANSADT